MVGEKGMRDAMKEVALRMVQTMTPEQIREFEIQLGYEIVKGMMRREEADERSLLIRLRRMGREDRGEE
jgi:hypothetical protein